MQWIDEQFDDFPQWWAERVKKTGGDSCAAIKYWLNLPNPRILTRGDAEIVDGVVMINGKRLTADQIKDPLKLID